MMAKFLSFPYCYFVFATFLLLACHLIGFDGFYGQDSFNYLRQAEHFLQLMNGEEFWPPMYACLGFLVNFIVKNACLSLQVISISAYASSAFLLNKILRHFFSNGNFISMYVFLFFMLSPFVLRSGIVAMSDALAVCFCTAVLYQYYCRNSEWTIFYIILLTSLAFLTRYVTVLFLFPFFADAVVKAIRRRNILQLLVALSIASLLIGITATYWISKAGSINHPWLKLWHLSNSLKSSFDTPDGNQSYLFPNFIYVLKNIFFPGFMPLFLPLLFFIRKIDFQRKMILLSVAFLIYALFLMGIPFQNDRFLLVSFPLVVIVCYAPFERMMHCFAAYRKFSAIVIFIVYLVCIVRAVYPVMELNRFERHLASSMKAYEGSTLYAFDADIALKGRGLVFDYHNLWMYRYEKFTCNALVLFNPDKFSLQWKDKNPMLNFEKLKSDYNLSLMHSYPKGWKLYKIECYPN